MRTLTVTINSDWKTVLREAGAKAQAGLASGTYQGETLNFATPGQLFSSLSEKRWNLIDVLLHSGPIGVRELSRRVQRDVKRVHEDAAALVELGLIEKDAKGALSCPFDEIHIDMRATRHAA
ncbi:hypothetical protein FG152_24670 [Ochrobactrum sp. XJ1]|nr:hypothetical protein [Ochrobactrum sp. XJ1]